MLKSEVHSKSRVGERPGYGHHRPGHADPHGRIQQQLHLQGQRHRPVAVEAHAEVRGPLEVAGLHVHRAQREFQTVVADFTHVVADAVGLLFVRQRDPLGSGRAEQPGKQGPDVGKHRTDIE